MFLEFTVKFHVSFDLYHKDSLVSIFTEKYSNRLSNLSKMNHLAGNRLKLKTETRTHVN